MAERRGRKTRQRDQRLFQQDSESENPRGINSTYAPPFPSFQKGTQVRVDERILHIRKYTKYFKLKQVAITCSSYDRTEPKSTIISKRNSRRRCRRCRAGNAGTRNLRRGIRRRGFRSGERPGRSRRDSHTRRHCRRGGRSTAGCS